jgi:ABC-type uncharacterized transport system auxiliary subunit
MRTLPLLLLLAVSACSLGSAPERTMYRLSPEAVLPPAHAAHHGGLIIELPLPDAESDLDSDAIEVETADKISQVDGAAWAEPLPVLLRPLIASTLERSGHYANVVSDDSDVIAGRRLQVNVERFTLELGSPPHVDVALKAELINPANGKLLKSARLSATEPVQAVRMHFVIPAFERALASCLRDLEAMAR